MPAHAPTSNIPTVDSSAQRAQRNARTGSELTRLFADFRNLFFPIGEDGNLDGELSGRMATSAEGLVKVLNDYREELREELDQYKAERAARQASQPSTPASQEGDTEEFEAVPVQQDQPVVGFPVELSAPVEEQAEGKLEEDVADQGRPDFIEGSLHAEPREPKPNPFSRFRDAFMAALDRPLDVKPIEEKDK